MKGVGARREERTFYIWIRDVEVSRDFRRVADNGGWESRSDRRWIGYHGECVGMSLAREWFESECGERRSDIRK